jgi:hypothetical protein
MSVVIAPHMYLQTAAASAPQVVYVDRCVDRPIYIPVERHIPVPIQQFIPAPYPVPYPIVMPPFPWQNANLAGLHEAPGIQPQRKDSRPQPPSSTIMRLSPVSPLASC